MPRFLLVSILLALASPAAAQVEWSGSWEQALDESRRRRAPILVAVLGDDCPACDELRDGLLDERELVQHLNERVVAVVAHAGAHRERTERIDGEQVSRCSLYRTVSCAEHHTTHDQVMPALFQGEAPEHPTLWICDSRGEGAERVDELTVAGVVALLDQAQERNGGPVILRSVMARAETKLASGDARVEKGKFKEAIRDYQSVAEDEALPESLRRLARERLTAVAQGARGAIEQARAMPKKKAKKALKRLLSEFKELDVTRQEIEEALAGL